MFDWITELFRPANPRSAALLAERLNPPAWFAIHAMTCPLPPSLSPRAEAIRSAFLAPFMAQVSKLHYADAVTRDQARKWWNLVATVRAGFWESLDVDTSDWPAGSWSEIRAHLLLGAPLCLSSKPAPAPAPLTARNGTQRTQV